MSQHVKYITNSPNFIKLLFVDGNPAGCKALLNDMGMIENVLRLPLVPTRIETKQKMNEILKGMRI